MPRAVNSYLTMLKVFVDTTKIRLRFDRLPKDVLEHLVDTARELDDQLLGRAKALAGGVVLQVRSGKFLARLRGYVRERRDGVWARVWSSAPTARLFEYGGKTGPHDIEPDKASALKLQIGGGTVFASKVHHPGGDFGRTNLGRGSRGKYSVINTAYDEMRTEIFTRMYDAAFEGVASGE